MKCVCLLFFNHCDKARNLEDGPNYMLGEKRCC
uniref:Uncharacterized protein n=1 Tax=Rhizophora mucronata TaxID=61149 RepID=A0A2P2PKM0_RHIMU